MFADVKKCSKCKQVLSLGSFHKNRTNKDGYQDRCKICLNQNRRDLYQKDKQKYSDYSRQLNLKKLYGLTVVQYDNLSKQQDFVCAICHQVNENGHRLVVDHSHLTGEIRGLLCHNCNLMLGHAKDGIKTLLLGIKYLQQFLS